MMETEDQVVKEMQEEFRKRLQNRLQEKVGARAGRKTNFFEAVSEIRLYFSPVKPGVPARLIVCIYGLLK